MRLRWLIIVAVALIVGLWWWWHSKSPPAATASDLIRDIVGHLGQMSGGLTPDRVGRARPTMPGLTPAKRVAAGVVAAVGLVAPEVPPAPVASAAVPVDPPVAQPAPSRWKREEKCCQILEKLTGKPFQRGVYYDFLRNPETGRNLQLDMFNEELMIAGEYSGRQHYSFPNYWHGSDEVGRHKFIAQQRRDRFKKRMCIKLGIHLIRIPYKIKDADLEEYIRARLPGNYVPETASPDA